jgi:hypothetical protein
MAECPDEAMPFEARDRLPEAIRAGILAMVRCARKREDSECLTASGSSRDTEYAKSNNINSG